MSNGKPSLAQDLTRAFNLTLKPARIIVLALGLLIGVAAAILFFWIGAFITPQGLRWLSWIVQRAGALIFGYVVLASMCSAVTMAHAESTGGRVGVPAGWALIGRTIGPVALATLKPIIVFLVLVAVIWLVGALGAIPAVGPVLGAILFIIAIPAGLLATFIIVKLLFVSFVFPAVLSTTKEKGITSYKESVRIIKGHAAHILGRLALALLVCLVFYKIIVAGFALTASHSSRTMGRNRATLRGCALLRYVTGIPGVEGSAPVGLGVPNPASPFHDASYTPAERYYATILAPSTAPPFLEPAAAELAAKELAKTLPGLRMKPMHKVGGWIFSFILLFLSVILFSLPLLFFSMSGYCAFLSFKDAPEIPLKMEAVDWSEIKQTAQEIAGKRKTEAPEKPLEEKAG